MNYIYNMQQLPGAKKSSRFGFMAPELCKPGQPPPGNDWIHEVKLDGYRIIALVQNKKVQLVSRNQKNWTKHFPTIAEALADIPVKQAIFDGELVALDDKGVSRFQLLQNALESHQKANLVYFMFDLLHLDGYDLARVPLIHRKRVIEDIFARWKKKPGDIRVSTFVTGEGPYVFQQACTHGLEGIISKKLDSVYTSKRTSDWIKSKCLHEEEFVIGGYTESEKARQLFGSLLLGHYDKKGKLIYCGHVGTGFSQKTSHKLHEMLSAIKQKISPFANPSREPKTHWVKPELVAQIRFTEWTDDGILRHASFQGLRDDKAPHRVKAEESEAIGDVTLTHPDKKLYLSPAVTKHDLAQFYIDIQDWILPYIVGRPLTIVRCPHGVIGKCFYQKHHTGSLPEGVKAIVTPKEKEPYLMIKDLSGLIGLVQMGVLEIHPWGANIKAMNYPDQITFDIDPAEDVPWLRVRQCALQLKQLLTKQGLISFVKTTGGKGLHVVVPLSGRQTWRQIQDYTKAVATSMMEKDPHEYTATMSKAKRQGKIFIDYLRNVQGATAIAAYCVRAREGAPVATPLSWSELGRMTKPPQFTLHNLRARLKRLKKDPWAKFFTLKQSLPKQ